MKEFTYPIFQALYQHLTLQTVGIIVGILLIVTHVLALVKTDAARDFLIKLPRSQAVGMVLLTIAFLWAMVLGSCVDLGEFSKARQIALYFVPISFVAMLMYANDYLGARALGILALLAATPILDAAFLQPVQSRLFLVGLAYVWILLGLFWVGMPYTLRDQVAWVTKTDGRIKLFAIAGLLYGGLILACALLYWGGLGRLVHK